MGREVKRVPPDWDWPVGKVWDGYVRPAPNPCPAGCVNGGTRALGVLDRLVHLILIAGGDSVSGGEPHPWLRTCVGIDPISADMAELTQGLAGRAPRLGGHDALDRWAATRKVIEAAGLDPSWGICPGCEGRGYHPDDESAQDAWERTEPPAGVGWQVWETVSEGSPISPVFADREGLIGWLCSDENRWGISRPLSRRQAEAFVEEAGHQRWLAVVER